MVLLALTFVPLSMIGFTALVLWLAGKYGDPPNWRWLQFAHLQEYLIPDTPAQRHVKTAGISVQRRNLSETRARNEGHLQKKRAD
jgi:hypothetical protein